MQNKLLLSLASIVLASSFAFADSTQQSGDNNVSNKHAKHDVDSFIAKRNHELEVKLGLTPEQKTKLLALQKELREKMKNTTTHESPLATYTTNGVFDKNAFVANAQEKSNNRINALADFFESFVAILTDEQKAKLKTLSPFNPYINKK